ncbi:hypothetical protein P7L54_06680 [Acinetobacter bereziniae]|uniref:hypothetical protein n=1 Tax=Acinetobacter bereziniae TaxID=106648 RepID=UPI00241239F4|nr:hypothetical protein [Acinetobacter bereziniae]MDG3555635.1 hypothetical protein [Acinetobacter bereziniae]
MATYTSNIPLRANNLQSLRDWIQLTHEALLSVGCVQTADTGQLTLAEIGAPVSGQHYVLGYRIYEINDNLSSSYPIYIKIVFAPRRLTNTSTEYAVPGGYIQVGFSTDGSGSITGPLLCNTYTFDGYTSNSSTVIYPNNCLSAACKLNGYLFLGIGFGEAWNIDYQYCATSFFLYLKRTVDVSGNPDGKGCVVVFPSGNSNFSNKAELRYQWGGKTPAYTGPIQTSPNTLPRMSSINGLIQANASDFSGWNYNYIDSDMASLVLTSVTPNTNIKLSTDGVTEKNYLVIPLLTDTASNFNNKGLHMEIDNRYKSLGALAVRFE